MQVHDGPQLDLSAQVALMRAKARPWKSIIALILAIAAAGTSGWARSYFAADHSVSQIIAAATAAAFCAFASATTIGLSRKARTVLEPFMGASHSAIVQYALVLIGAVTTLVVTLVLFGVPVGQLLLGGALTSVFVGIAAQQALSNVFAGLVLLLAHPFKVGEAIRLRAGALSGEITGTVSEIGITYVRLVTSTGVVSVPNSQVLNAVVGPMPPPDPTQPAPTQPAPPLAAQPLSQPPAAPVSAESSHHAANGSSAGPVGTAHGAAGPLRPGAGGEQ